MKFFYLPIREKENIGEAKRYPLTHELAAMEWLFYVPVGHSVNPLNVKSSLDDDYDFDDDLPKKQNVKPNIDFDKTIIYYNDYRKVHDLLNDKNGDYSIKSNTTGTPALFVSFRNIASWFKRVIRPEVLRIDGEIEALKIKLKSRNYVPATKTNQSNHIKRLQDYRAKLVLTLDILRFLRGTFEFVEDKYKIINEATINIQIQEKSTPLKTTQERADTLIFKKINEERRKRNKEPFKTFRYDYLLNNVYKLWEEIHSENRKLFTVHINSKSAEKNKQKKNQTWALRKVVETIYYILLELNNTSSIISVYCQEPKVIFSKDNESCEKRLIEKNIPKSRKFIEFKDTK